MEGFKLSENFDTDKVFIINLSELSNRIDPYFYQKEFSALREELLKKGFVKIGNILKSWNRGDGPRDGFYTEDESGVYFLRVNNLKNNCIDLKDVKLINRKIHEQTLKRTQVTGGDLIFAISGTKENLGTVSIIPDEIKEANLNSALVRLDIDKSKITNSFFCLLFDLNFIRKQIEFIGKGAAQNNLNNEEIKSIRIPDLPIDKQEELVDYINDQRKIVKQKESEAQKLLDSIDDYLLDELGISLPSEQPEENELKLVPEARSKYGYKSGFELDKENMLVKKGRIFLTDFSEIEGRRWDAFEVVNRSKKIEGGIFANKKLKQIATLIKGTSITSDSIIEGKYPVIAGGQTSPYNHDQFNFDGNIITVSASGAYSGYVWYHDYPIFASDCTVISSKDESEISTIFLSEILKLKQKEIYNLQQGAGQPHVYSKDLAYLNIPIPTVDKQREIISKIIKKRDYAEKLRLEGITLLEEAKNMVERLILC